MTKLPKLESDPSGVPSDDLDHLADEPKIIIEQFEQMQLARFLGRTNSQKPALRHSASAISKADNPAEGIASPPPPKSILRKPTEKFPEDPSPTREGVASPTDAKKSKDIPPDARWTKIDRWLVNPQALEESNERFEERRDCVIVLRVLPREDIQKLADRTKQIREARGISESWLPRGQRRSLKDTDRINPLPWRSAEDLSQFLKAGKFNEELFDSTSSSLSHTSHPHDPFMSDIPGIAISSSDTSRSGYTSSRSSFASSRSGLVSSRSSFASSRSSFVSSRSSFAHSRPSYDFDLPFRPDGSVRHWESFLASPITDENIRALEAPSPWWNTENGDITKISQKTPPLPRESIRNNPSEDYGAHMRKHIIDKLMVTVYELLGYSSCEDSDGSLSSDSASDAAVGEDIAPDLDNLSEIKEESEPVDEDSGASDGVQTQTRAGDTNIQPTGDAAERQLARPESKRRRACGDDRTDDEDDEGRNKRRKDLKSSGTRQRRPRFACPFYKRNPETYAYCTSCVRPGFDTIARLKEHLYRKHVTHICRRCHLGFENNDALLDHLTGSERCIPCDEPFERDGLDGGQVKMLRTRSRGRIEEEKWRNIYRICHRLAENAHTPSPYCDHDSLAAQAVESYDQFQRERLPDLIRERLETDFESNPQLVQLYERLSDSLPDIIRESQRDLYETYTNLRRDDAELYQPSDLDTSQTTTMLPEMSTAGVSVTRSSPLPNATGPPVAFEAPPNTDDGMTPREAHQVSSRPGLQHDLNSDSGYESNRRDSRSDNAEESDGPQPADSLGDVFPFQDDLFRSLSASEFADLYQANLGDLFESLPMSDGTLFSFGSGQS